MSWRERLSVPVSNAEYTATTELQKQGLTQGMVTQRAIELKPAVNGQRRSTRPDWWWLTSNKLVYLDGDKVHKGKRLDIDEEIMQELTDKGYQVLRVPFTAGAYPKPQGGFKNDDEFHRVMGEILEFVKP